MDFSHTALINQFKHRCVRDLAWVIVSPPLVSGFIDDVHWWNHEECLSEFNDCVDGLTKIDQQPKPLIDHLVNLKNKKLGSVFEGLISFWLAISPNYEKKLSNIQIIQDKHTYGELDFIIEELATGKIIHLEVAVKFYLGSNPLTDAYRWFGTTIIDQLGKKIDHLRTHQTQLSNKYPDQIKQYFPHTIDEKHCIVKGRLFYPENQDLINPSPQNISLAKNHLRGRWSYIDEGLSSKSLIKIDKSHWLAEFNTQDIKEFDFTSKKLLSEIDRAECYVEAEKIEEYFFERQRIFYLPRNFSFPKDK